MDDNLFLLTPLTLEVVGKIYGERKPELLIIIFCLFIVPWFTIFMQDLETETVHDLWHAVLGLFHELFSFELQFSVRFKHLDVMLSSWWAAALPHTLWQCKLGTCLCLTGSWNLSISILGKAKYQVRRTHCSSNRLNERTIYFYLILKELHHEGIYHKYISFYLFTYLF